VAQGWQAVRNLCCLATQTRRGRRTTVDDRVRRVRREGREKGEIEVGKEEDLNWGSPGSAASLAKSQTELYRPWPLRIWLTARRGDGEEQERLRRTESSASQDTDHNCTVRSVRSTQCAVGTRCSGQTRLAATTIGGSIRKGRREREDERERRLADEDDLVRGGAPPESADDPGAPGRVPGRPEAQHRYPVPSTPLPNSLWRRYKHACTEYSARKGSWLARHSLCGHISVRDGGGPTDDREMEKQEADERRWNTVATGAE
jgi:hypothetical protein